MERIISEQDRIRRAEEIASRRRRGTISANNINFSNEKRKMSLLTKIFIQTITSMCIFGIAYFMHQNNSSIIENIKPVLSQDINFEEIYNKGSASVQSFMSFIEKDDSKEGNNLNNNLEENKAQENVTENVNQTETENQNTIETENQVGMGGTAETVILSQDEQDIAYIKENASIIMPVNGTLTSGYGKRTPTDIISENHAGIDLGASVGTEIIAAMEGTVELVSSYGDYGNHLKITNGEISTLYAHCSKILVNQGDYISQGQKIAEVGNTGRTTGPHLHFEISRNGRTVNPTAILQI